MAHIHPISSAEKHSDKLSVIKYDVEGDNNKNLKVEMLLQGVMVRGLPTLILYNDGKPLATHSGVITQDGLEHWLEESMSEMDDLEMEAKQSTSTPMSTKKEESKKDEGVAGPKRGFVSFATQVDDYAL